MSLADIKEQASALPVEEQAELLSFLAERFRRDDPEYRAEMARLIDDKSPAGWVKWSDLKKEFESAAPERLVSWSYTVFLSRDAARFLRTLKSRAQPCRSVPRLAQQFPSSRGDRFEYDETGRRIEV